MGERPRNLIGACDPGVGDTVRWPVGELGTQEAHAPRVGAVMAAHDIDQCRLARSIGSDQTQNLAFVQLEIDAVERIQALERLSQRPHRQQRLALGGFDRRRMALTYSSPPRGYRA